MSDICLVTGGAGFIGCALSKHLGDAFDRVVVVDNLHPQIHPSRTRPAALHASVELVIADVTEATTWNDILADLSPDFIIHLAAETGTGQSLTEGTRHATVNVVGTTQMLDAFVRHSKFPKRIILSSSRAVYGEGAWKSITDDQISYPGQRSKAMLEAAIWDFPDLEPLPFDAAQTKASPTSVYGATKLTQEQIIAAWALSFQVDYRILRLQNVYGPGQSLYNSYTGIVSLFARLAREGKQIPVYEDGNIVRDFVYIDDVVSAILLSIQNEKPFCNPYDIGSGVPTSILSLANAIAEHYRAPTPQINGMYRNGDVRSACCLIDRAADELGYAPAWSVNRGVSALCDWIDGQLVSS